MTFKTKNGIEITDEMLEQIAETFENGQWPDGETRIVAGRPLMLGEELQSITYKDTKTKVSAMDERAKALGMNRSDYLRNLVSQDLANASLA